MTSSLDPGSKPAVPHGLRLQWEEVQDCYVILYPEGMVKLSLSAGEIMQRCDGQRTIADIVKALTNEFPDANLTDDVYKFLEVAYENGWLRNRSNE